LKKAVRMKTIDIKNLNDIKNILIIRRNNIGDMICAIPVLKTIRREFPQAYITVLADSTNAGIIEGASFIDRVLIYKKGEGLFKNKYLNHWRLFRESGIRFDLAIALKIGFSSTLSLITLISGARLRAGCIPEKWHPLQLCYNFPVKGYKRWKSIHQIDALLEFIKTLGIRNPIKDITIEINHNSRENVREFLKKHGIVREDIKIIVFNISSNKPENTWSPERFKETADVVSKHYNDKPIYIITSVPSDKDRALRLSKEVRKAFYFETPGIMDFAAVVAESDLLICGEGGAMHTGAAVSTPTISLWGSLRPVKWLPYGERQYVLRKKEHVDSISATDVLEVIKKNNLLR